MIGMMFALPFRLMAIRGREIFRVAELLDLNCQWIPDPLIADHQFMPGSGLPS